MSKVVTLGELFHLTPAHRNDRRRASRRLHDRVTRQQRYRDDLEWGRLDLGGEG